MKPLLMPSLIAKSPADARAYIERLLSYTSHFQLDIMDGELVKTRSLMEGELHDLPKRNKNKPIVYEAHLMMRDPLPWIRKNHEAIESVVIHYESDAELHETMKEIRKYHKKVGLAINPGTPIESITPYLNKLDKVVIMTVQPGAYGAAFIPAMLTKIRHVRERFLRDIEVDGGIKPLTLLRCKRAGANQFVVGSYLKNSKNLRKSWNELTSVFEN